MSSGNHAQMMRLADMQASKNRIKAAHAENRMRHLSNRASSRTTHKLPAGPKKTLPYKQWMSPVAKPSQKSLLHAAQGGGGTPAFQSKLNVQSPSSFHRVSSNASEAMQSYRRFQNRVEFAKKLGPLQNQEESVVSLSQDGEP